VPSGRSTSNLKSATPDLIPERKKPGALAPGFLRGDGVAVGVKRVRPTDRTYEDVLKDLSSRHKTTSCFTDPMHGHQFRFSLNNVSGFHMVTISWRNRHLH
jgi:hypothetical protein